MRFRLEPLGVALLLTACANSPSPVGTPRPAALVGASASVIDEDAGSPASTEDEQTPTRLTTRLEGHSAIFDARYEFHHIRGGASDYAVISVPDGGVVTAAVAVVDGVRYPLHLSDAQPLDESFTKLLEGEQGPDAGRMILVSQRNGSVVVSVALPGPSDVSVELAIAAPTCLLADQRYVALPADWKALENAPKPDACDSPSATWHRFATTELADARDRVGILGGRLTIGSTVVARVDVGLPHELADTPKDLATAIVFDASRSVSAKQLAAQRAIIGAYLALVPNSRVQVFATARRARPILPGWLLVSSATPRLERELSNLQLANGSNLDASIAAAEQWLAQLPGADSATNGFSSHRIIVLSDGRVPTRLDESPPISHTLTHVIELSDQNIGLVRDDDISIAKTAIATTGVSFRAGGSKVDAAVLLRPLSIESLSFTAAGWTSLERTNACGDTLDVARSCVWWGKSSVPSSPVVVSGLLWNRKVERIVTLDPRYATSLARELSAQPSSSDKPPFDSMAQAAIDRAAHAVTASTSLAVRWGGPGGYGHPTVLTSVSDPDTNMSTGHFGTGGSRDTGRIVHQMDLRPQLAPVVARCKARGHRAAIELETTGNEIVEVSVNITPPDEAIRDCISEAIWDLELMVTDDLFRANRRVSIDS